MCDIGVNNDDVADAEYRENRYTYKRYTVVPGGPETEYWIDDF